MSPTPVFRGRLATSVCQARHNQAGLGPTEPCSRPLLGSVCDWGRYYQAAHSTWPIPTETQIPCWTLVACLFHDC